MKSIVITGSSSGIGKATAKYFAERGWRVAATMRQPENETELNQVENISLYALDVTEEASIQTAAQQIIKDFGTVDVVLNNAGYAVMGPFEATTDEQIRRQFETNVFGLMNVTQAFLPHFRAKQAGMFINVSSIGGLLSLPFMSLYHGTKWTVEGFSESLSYELREFGIQVKIIEPGAIQTDFISRSMVRAAQPGLDAYNGTLEKFLSNMGTVSGSNPEVVAEAIFQAATDGKTQLRYLVGAFAEQWVGFRQTNGADAFVEMIKEQLL